MTMATSNFAHTFRAPAGDLFSKFSSQGGPSLGDETRKPENCPVQETRALSGDVGRGWPSPET